MMGTGKERGWRQTKERKIGTGTGAGKGRERERDGGGAPWTNTRWERGRKQGRR